MNGFAFAVISGSGVSPSPGDVQVDFEAIKEYPLVSITTMIAPSPDWFVAVSNVLLYNDGKWVEEISTNAVVYDAGTDSGLTFTSPNSKTKPPVSIFKISNPPLGENGVVAQMGSFRFERIQ